MRARCQQNLISGCGSAQASYDPNNIAALLQQYPYHIDSLMAMFELYRVRATPATDILATCCALEVHVPGPLAVVLLSPALMAAALCLHRRQLIVHRDSDPLI
jgi:hypothetical protein